jgi:hypothetical protein
MHVSPPADAKRPYGPAPTGSQVAAREPERSRSEILDSVVVAADSRRVVIRLVGGEELDVGAVQGREAAMKLARETAAAVDDAVLARTWPEVGDRLLRPGAIVSVDVVRD